MPFKRDMDTSQHDTSLDASSPTHRHSQECASLGGATTGRTPRVKDAALSPIRKNVNKGVSLCSIANQPAHPTTPTVSRLAVYPSLF